MRKDLDWLRVYRQHPLFEKCVSVNCHKGWISLLEETVKYIEYSNRRTDFDLLITQVKPKFGLLVIYIEPQDHTNLRINVLTNKEIGSLNEISNSFYKKLLLFSKYLFGKSTLMKGTGATSAVHLDLDQDGEVDTRIQIVQFSETGRHGSDGKLFSSSQPGFSISITAINPKSKGKITISSNGNSVDPRHLSSNNDIELLKKALKFSLKLLRSSHINSHILKIEDEAIIKNDPEKYITDNFYSGFHLIGGLQGAINSNFEVHNIKGLYVCDASVFDRYAASNIHSSVVLIADLFAKRFITNNFNF